MKKNILFLFLISLLSCSDDSDDRNSFLPNVTVNFSVNLNLPEGNGILINGFKIFPEKGIRGVIIFNNGLENFTAFDMACPHIELQDCSTMTFEQSDLNMTCDCDDEKFSKIDGAPTNPEIQQAARAYIVTKNGSILNIRN